MEDPEGELAASPLTVIAVVAAVTALLVGVVVYVVADEPAPSSWALGVAPAADGPGFLVLEAPDGVAWADLGVVLLDPGGFDRAAVYLEVPAGDVEAGQVLALQPDMPAGPYVLRILRDGSEVARAVYHVG